MHVDLVAGDRLALAVDGRYDFGCEVLRGLLVCGGKGKEGEEGREACFVVDDVGDGGGR